MNGMFGDDTGNLFEGLLGFINNWKPAHYSNEKEYQTALYDVLYGLKPIVS